MNPISKAIEKMSGYRHNAYTVFRDFAEMSAIAISNAVDKPQYEKREEIYINIVKKYDKSEANQIANMLGMLVMELESNPRDVLGETYMELEMGNERAGQFFTPYHLSVMMAKMTFGDAAGIIADQGYLTVQEPAVGAGGMIIALAGELADQEINYQQKMHVTAMDIDPVCVHMSYLQFSLLHIPAVVVHGDTLKLEEWGHWYTPAHIMGLWDYRLNKNKRDREKSEVTQQAEALVHQPVISLFDGSEITKEHPKQDRKQAPKQTPKTGGQQLSIF